MIKYWNKVKEAGRQYSSFHWPSVELVLSFISTYSVLSDILTKNMAEFGLSRAAFNVLMILSRKENKKCKHCEIGRLMFVSRANITGLVDGLVDQGLAERRRDPEDRRIWLVAITPKGETLLKKLLPVHYEQVTKICESIPDEKKQEISRALLEWRAVLAELDDKKI